LLLCFEHRALPTIGTAATHAHQSGRPLTNLTGSRAETACFPAYSGLQFFLN
jgi:hypothetical protein